MAHSGAGATAGAGFTAPPTPDFFTDFQLTTETDAAGAEHFNCLGTGSFGSGGWCGRGPAWRRIGACARGGASAFVAAAQSSIAPGARTGRLPTCHCTRSRSCGQRHLRRCVAGGRERSRARSYVRSPARAAAAQANKFWEREVLLATNIRAELEARDHPGEAASRRYCNRARHLLALGWSPPRRLRTLALAGANHLLKVYGGFWRASTSGSGLVSVGRPHERKGARPRPAHARAEAREYHARMSE